MEYVIFVFLGVMAGCIGTIIGAGGGFILIPVMILFFSGGHPELLQPEFVTTVSLAVVLANAASGSAAYLRMKRVDVKSAILFGLAGVPSAVFGAYEIKAVHYQLFNIIFGVLMVCVSIFLFLRPKRDAGHAHPVPGHALRHIVEADGTEHRYSYNLAFGVTLSFLIGFLASMMGIGGGIIHVPVMVQFMNFPVHVATATSHSVLVIISLSATVVHICTGSFSKGLWMIIPLAIGAIVGAQIGAKLSQKLKGKLIIRLLAIALCLVGFRILILGLRTQ